MAKAYTKPQIVFDCFELTENIAGCTFLSTNHAPYSCPVYDPEFGYSIFTDSIICDSTPPGGNDSICYNIPVADYSVYIS